MNNFFKYPVNSSEACGAFSFEHIAFIIICIVLILIGLVLTIKYVKNMNKFLFIIGIVSLIFEMIKIIWGTMVNRYTSWVSFLPLWFCSLFVPASLIAGLSKGKLKQFALSFMFYGGIVGGVIYLFMPTTSLYQYPAFHFLSFHSMFYHSVMIYVGFVIIIKGLVKPNLKDFWFYFGFTTVFCIISYIFNMKYGTNFMFLNSTSNNAVLKILKDVTGSWYPVALTLFQNGGTFFISFGVYKVVAKLMAKKDSKSIIS